MLSLISVLLTFAGFVITSFLYKTKNKLLALGFSMIVGFLGFLLVLSLGSYLFKGQLSIALMFFIYLLFAIFLAIRNPNTFTLLKIISRFKFSFGNLITVAIIGFYLGLILLYAHRSFIGSDTDIYFSIATSFAKGNYPTVLSWQPQFLTIYHQGALLIEGALWALSGKDIELIHYFFSVYTLWAIFILTTGVAREKVRNLLCIIPAIFVIILVGGPVVLTKATDLNFSLNNLFKLPDFLYFQSSNGAGAADLQGLIYNNFYSFGLASFLIFLFLLAKQSAAKFNLKRFLLLSALATLNCSIDEAFFPIELILLVGLFFWQIRGFPLFKGFTYSAVLIICLVILFFLIQNPIRDSFLTPSPDFPRFKLLIESNFQPLKQLTYRPEEVITWNGVNTGSTAINMFQARIKYAASKTVEDQGVSFTLLDLKILMALLLLTLILKPDRFGFFLFVSSFLSFILSLFVINTFWPPNAYRISNQAYQLAFLAFGLVLINFRGLKSPRSSLISLAVALSILFLIIPQMAISHAKIIKTITTAGHNNFTRLKKDLDLEMITKYIPPSKVMVFLDRYPDAAPHSYLNYTALTKMGVFVPIAPPSIKILNPSPGIEWLDGVNTLSPYAFKELNIDYVYVQNAALARLSAQRVNQLKNKDYFDQVKSFGEEGILYQIKPPFKEIKDEEASLKKMSLSIGGGKKVYLDKLSFPEVRRALILELAKNNHLIGPPHAHGGDFYMYIEAILPFEPERPEALNNLDYVLMDRNKSPNSYLPGKFEKILTNNYVSLYINHP